MRRPSAIGERLARPPEELAQWRGGIQRELEELGSSRSVDDLEICSILWFVITDADLDQTPAGKATWWDPRRRSPTRSSA